MFERFNDLTFVCLLGKMTFINCIVLGDGLILSSMRTGPTVTLTLNTYKQLQLQTFYNVKC